MLNVEYLTQRQFEQWFVSVLKVIKEMLLFNVTEVSDQLRKIQNLSSAMNLIQFNTQINSKILRVN